MSGVIPIGAILGSIIVLPLAERGRRLALIVISIIIIFATALTMVMNFFALVIGRLIVGMCVGAYVSVCPIYVGEISPASISGPLGSLGGMGVSTGFVIAFTIPFILPLPDEPAALTTDLWRVVFMVPAIFGLLTIFMFLVFFRYDTPIFYKKKNDMENYEKIMS